jgi:Fe-S-cluster containining protein
MLLSTEDIARLEEKGYKKEFFMRVDNAGYAVLRNRRGCCVFYVAEQRRCEVYGVRPSGCRVYPVVFDEEKGVVADIVCQSWETVTDEEKVKQGRKVVRLLERLDREAKQRRLR